MRTANLWEKSTKGELCLLDAGEARTDVNRSKKGEIHQSVGRKGWSNRDGGGIIKTNQERVEVQSHPGCR
jgi:hypothetical protein